jgi:hypothetical protein
MELTRPVRIAYRARALLMFAVDAPGEVRRVEHGFRRIAGRDAEVDRRHLRLVLQPDVDLRELDPEPEGVRVLHPGQLVVGPPGRGLARAGVRVGGGGVGEELPGSAAYQTGDGGRLLEKAS